MIAALLCLTLSGMQAPDPTSAVAITAVAVVPMDRERVLEGATVLVRGDRIATVARARVTSCIQEVASARAGDGCLAAGACYPTCNAETSTCPSADPVLRPLHGVARGSR